MQEPTTPHEQTALPDHVSPPSSPVQCARIRHDLRQMIQTSWPAGSGSFNKTLTIATSSTYRVYAEDQDPEKLFEKACSWLTGIREQEMDDTNGAIVERELLTGMAVAIYGSNQIERAGLDRDITLHLCDQIFRGEDVGDLDERHEDYEQRLREMITAYESLKHMPAKHIIHGRREVVQHAKAFYYMIHAIVVQGEPLTEELIKNAHGILCKGVPIIHYDGTTTDYRQYAGIYRNSPVRAGNTMFTTPNMIPRAMQMFIQSYNADMAQVAEEGRIDPFALAAKYCLDFVQIHPFQDGNGRMCRIILNALLCRYVGVIVPIGEYEEERVEYLDIKKRASAQMEGHGELSTLVLKKASTRLRCTKQKLAGKKNSRQ